MSTTTAPTTGTEPVMSAASAAHRMFWLAAGPFLTLAVLYAAADRAVFPDTFLTWGMAAAALAWSPLPGSLPAVLLDEDRAAALPNAPRLVRAVALVPWMLLRSPARVEMAVSLAGFSVLAWLAVTAF